MSDKVQLTFSSCWHPIIKQVTLVYLYHVNRCGHHKKMSIAKLDFVQVSGLSLNFYNNICVSFTNSATVERLEQVQLCNRLIDQSADNITGLKCAKECLMGNFKKNGFFYIFPNLIKIKKFQEQLIILEGDHDGHFFAQGYFGSQSLHRKKIFQFFVPKRSGV